MGTNFKVMAKKLQNAINDKFHERIIINKQQFYSEQQDRPVTFWVIKKTIYDAGKERNQYIELFSTMSQVQVVLFLRDYWYELNGWDVPTDNEIWNEAKAKYYAKRDRDK